MKVTNLSSSLPASCSLNPKLRRMSQYSRTAFRSVFIAHLPATARRAFAGHRDPLGYRSWLSEGFGDPTTRRSPPARRRDATVRWLIHGEIDGLREWEPQDGRAAGDAERSIPRPRPLESREGALWRARRHADWYGGAVRAADTRRSLGQPPPAEVTRFASHPCRERSTVPRSSQCHRARELLLHRNVNLVGPAGARWRSRD